jgi:hypothetical protein
MMRRVLLAEAITEADRSRKEIKMADYTQAKSEDRTRGFGVNLITVAVTALITFLVTYLAGKGLDWYFADEKTLQVTLLPSQNLVAVPNALSGRLEVSYVNGPNDKQAVQSLFGYRITILNKSRKQTAENITLYIFPPENVTLIEPPQVSTVPEPLANIIESQHVPTKNGMGVTLAYLQSDQSITYSYTGLSKQKIEGPTWPSVEVNAKDWKPVYQRSDDLKNNAQSDASDLKNLLVVAGVIVTVFWTLAIVIINFIRVRRVV